MTTVRRYNVILQIDDDKDLIQKYMDKGYSIVDERGHVIKEALPSDVGELQIKVRELQKKVKELTAELALYKNMIPEEKPQEEIVEVPKRGRKPKK